MADDIAMIAHQEMSLLTLVNRKKYKEMARKGMLIYMSACMHYIYFSIDRLGAIISVCKRHNIFLNTYHRLVVNFVNHTHFYRVSRNLVR